MSRKFGHSRRYNRIIIGFIDISGEYINKENQVRTLPVPLKSHMFFFQLSKLYITGHNELF